MNMLKTILLTSGLALTTLFSQSGIGHTNAATTSVNTLDHSKWQQLRTEYKGTKDHNAEKVNQHKKLIKLVGKYSPDKLDQWKQAISQRDGLLSQLKSDEMKHLRKQNRQTVKSSLRAKIKSGELTKKQALQQFKEHFKQLKDKHNLNVHKGKGMAAKLKVAIEKKDSKTIQTILNDRLQKFVTKNEALSKKIVQWKTNSTSGQSTSSNVDNTQM
jgi:hypothetical protein